VLRDLLDGKITNERFLQLFPRDGDEGIEAIFAFVWTQFSDLRVHTLTGSDTPQPEARAALERCWEFLRTELTFDWPVPKPSLIAGFLSLFGLDNLLRGDLATRASKGDFDVWPFFTRSDYLGHSQQHTDR
jgi:hypothetical protein